MTNDQLLALAKQLTEALDDLADGEDCYTLSNSTGWSIEHCQGILDVLHKAKLLLEGV